MTKVELKRLSKKYLGSESRYVKLMENGIQIPRVEATGKNGEDGKPTYHQILSMGVPLFETKRYSQEEIENLFTDFEIKEAEQKEKERLEGLAASVRGLTSISNR